MTLGGLSLAAPQPTQFWGGKGSLGLVCSSMTIGLSESPELSHSVRYHHEPTENHRHSQIESEGETSDLCSPYQSQVHRCEGAKGPVLFIVSLYVCRAPRTRPVGYMGSPRLVPLAEVSHAFKTRPRASHGGTGLSSQDSGPR